MKGKLRSSLHQRLRLLARGPRRYGEGDQEFPRLMKMGLVEPIGATSTDESREWAITEVGRIMLLNYSRNELFSAEKSQYSALLADE